jgi:NADH-quinone oxidoreductase subunit N
MSSPAHEDPDLSAADCAVLGIDFVKTRTAMAASSMPVLIVLATLGMGMMVSATTLIALYLGLELHVACRST